MNRRKDRLLLMAERGRFMLTLDSEEAWDGILVDWDDNYYLLGDALHLAPGDSVKVKADGEIWVPRARVKYMQRV